MVTVTVNQCDMMWRQAHNACQKTKFKLKSELDNISLERFCNRFYRDFQLQLSKNQESFTGSGGFRFHRFWGVQSCRLGYYAHKFQHINFFLGITRWSLIFSAVNTLLDSTGVFHNYHPNTHITVTLPLRPVGGSKSAQTDTMSWLFRSAGAGKAAIANWRPYLYKGRPGYRTGSDYLRENIQA